MKLKSIIPLMLVFTMALGVIPVQEGAEDAQSIEIEQIAQEVDMFEVTDLDINQPNYFTQAGSHFTAPTTASQFAMPAEHHFVTSNQGLYLAFNRLKIIATRPYDLSYLA